MKPIHIAKEEGKLINVLGIPMLIRVHGHDTGGTLSVVESHDAPNAGTPPHIHHREDETFQVLEGEYEFIVAGQRIVATKGATLFAPRSVPHSYRCISDTPGRLSVVITPAGFEGFFEEANELSPEQLQDISNVTALGERYGLEILAG